jgi:polyisoprenoid-binding protein YceI
MMGKQTSRRASLAVIPSALFAAGVILSSGSGAIAQTTATPTPMGVIAAADGLAQCGTSEIGALPADLKPAQVYAIDPQASEARYRAQEELAQVGKTEAVGKTQAIVGQIALDQDGTPLACSRFDVDLRTLHSDQAKRDNYLYKNTLEAEKYPVATFVLRKVEGLDGPLSEGQETPLTLIGDLTLHGVTKLVAWDAKATRDDGGLVGSAATQFEMPDFAIQRPSVPVVLSLDETVRLEVDLTARPT